MREKLEASLATCRENKYGAARIAERVYSTKGGASTIPKMPGLTLHRISVQDMKFSPYGVS